MANFIPQTADNSPQRCMSLAVAVNAALRGDTANIGRLSCAAGASSVTVKDKRCRAGRLAILIPLDSVAAGLDWWLDSMTRDEMTFKFSSAPTKAAVFGWALIGDGYEV
jgi:hypothetical protein